MTPQETVWVANCNIVSNRTDQQSAGEEDNDNRQGSLIGVSINSISEKKKAWGRTQIIAVVVPKNDTRVVLSIWVKYHTRAGMLESTTNASDWFSMGPLQGSHMHSFRLSAEWSIGRIITARTDRYWRAPRKKRCFTKAKHLKKKKKKRKIPGTVIAPAPCPVEIGK